MKKLKSVCLDGRNVKTVQLLWTTVWWFLKKKKLNIELYYAAAAAAAKSLQSCLTLCDFRDSSPPGSRPWDSPGKNTGVGCHFLLQCIVKSESEVTQSCPTLHDPTDCSLPGSSIHGISQARVLEWVAIAFSEFDLTRSQKLFFPEHSTF